MNYRTQWLDNGPWMEGFFFHLHFHFPYIYNILKKENQGFAFW
jgi:hypothetical protein